MLGQRSTIRNLRDYGQHISVLDKSGVDIIQSRVYCMKFEEVKTVNPQKFVESKCFLWVLETVIIILSCTRNHFLYS